MAFKKGELVEGEKFFSFSPTFDFSRARGAALSREDFASLDFFD